MKNQVFKNDGDTFSAYYAATNWLLENGYSVGSMERHSPIGFMKGDFTISKWSGMTNDERNDLDGYIKTDSDFRNGNVELVFREGK